MMPVNVLVISHSAAQKSARLRYNPLKTDSRFSITLISPDRWFEFGKWLDIPAVCKNDITTYIMPINFPRMGKASWYMHYYPNLKKILRKTNPNVIHLWEEPWSFIAAHTVLLRNKLCPKTSIILEVDQNIYKKLPLPFEFIRRYVLRNTDFILARSEDAANVVRKCGYAGPIEFIGYGVDEFTFYDNLSIKETNSFTIGYAGRIIYEKGIDTVIKALARIKNHTSLFIMGDGPYKKELQKLVVDLKLEDKVKFLPASNNPTHVAEFMRKIDISVLMTRTTKIVKEQFGRSIIESQACGTPVLGSTCGQIPAVIGKGGWIVEEENIDSLADKIDFIINNRYCYEKAKEAGLSQIKTKYSFNHIANILSNSWLKSIKNRL